MPHGENLAFGVPIVTRDVFNFLDALDMSLQVNSWSNEARTVQVRGYNRHGFISHDHTTNSDRSLATTTTLLQDFPLEFQVSTTDTSVRRGELYVRVNLVMGGFNVGCLCAGYVTDEEFPCYPVQSPYKSIDGKGFLRSIAGTNPGVNTEISESVPTNARWKLKAFIATLVAAAGGSTRTPQLVIDDGVTELARVPSALGIAGGVTSIFTFAALGDDATVATVSTSQPLIHDLELLQGWRIRTVTNNLAVADDWGAPQLLVEELIEE